MSLHALLRTESSFFSISISVSAVRKSAQWSVLNMSVLTATKFRSSFGIIHDRSCLFQEMLPVARIAEELLHFALTVVVIKQPDVK